MLKCSLLKGSPDVPGSAFYIVEVVKACGTNTQSALDCFGDLIAVI